MSDYRIEHPHEVSPTVTEALHRTSAAGEAMHRPVIRAHEQRLQHNQQLAQYCDKISLAWTKGSNQYLLKPILQNATLELT